MADPTLHFLLVYSFADSKLIHNETYLDPRKATEAYNECEKLYQGSSDYEIVLVGSDSIETIMKTHGHYFRDESDSLFSQYLEPAHDRGSQHGVIF